MLLGSVTINRVENCPHIVLLLAYSYSKAFLVHAGEEFGHSCFLTTFPLFCARSIRDRILIKCIFDSAHSSGEHRFTGTLLQFSQRSIGHSIQEIMGIKGSGWQIVKMRTDGSNDFILLEDHRLLRDLKLRKVIISDAGVQIDFVFKWFVWLRGSNYRALEERKLLLAFD